LYSCKDYRDFFSGLASNDFAMDQESIFQGSFQPTLALVHAGHMKFALKLTEIRSA